MSYSFLHTVHVVACNFIPVNNQLLFFQCIENSYLATNNPACQNSIKNFAKYMYVVMCLGRPPKFQIQVVVRSFDMYRVSQSRIVMRVRYIGARTPQNEL